MISRLQDTLMNFGNSFLDQVHLNNDYLVEGRLGQDAVILQGLAKGGGRFLIRKASRRPLPFQLRSARFFSFFTIDDLVDPQTKVDIFVGPRFKLVSDEPVNLKFTDEEMLVLKKLCELRTVIRIVNNPQVDGFQIYISKKIADDEAQFNAAIAVIKTALRTF